MSLFYCQNISATQQDHLLPSLLRLPTCSILLLVLEGAPHRHTKCFFFIHEAILSNHFHFYPCNQLQTEQWPCHRGGKKALFVLSNSDFGLLPCIYLRENGILRCSISVLHGSEINVIHKGHANHMNFLSTLVSPNHKHNRGMRAVQAQKDISVKRV